MTPDDLMTGVPPDRRDFEYKRAVAAAKVFPQVPVVERLHLDEPPGITHFGEERRRVVVRCFWPDVFGTPVPKGAERVTWRGCTVWMSSHDEWESAGK